MLSQNRLSRLLRLYSVMKKSEEYYKRRLIRVGGSICVPIPTEIRRQLRLISGVEVTMWVDDKGDFHVAKVEDEISDSVGYR